MSRTRSTLSTPNSTPVSLVFLVRRRDIVVVGAVELWESRSDFQGAVGRVENHPPLLEGTAASRDFPAFHPTRHLPSYVFAARFFREQARRQGWSGGLTLLWCWLRPQLWRRLAITSCSISWLQALIRHAVGPSPVPPTPWLRFGFNCKQRFSKRTTRSLLTTRSTRNTPRSSVPRGIPLPPPAHRRSARCARPNTPRPGSPQENRAAASS